MQLGELTCVHCQGAGLEVHILVVVLVFAGLTAAIGLAALLLN
jgi:hypothetical protein